MRVRFEIFAAPIAGMAGILIAAAAGLTLPQHLKDRTPAGVYASESDFLDALDTVVDTRTNADAAQAPPKTRRPEPEDEPAASSSTRVPVLGHYPGYAAQNLPVDRIRYEKLTRIAYFSVWPMADGDPNVSEVNVTDLRELVARADANGVRTLITVGGWERSAYFAPMAASARTRANFATKLLQYCLDYDLDGAELDWEPVSTANDRTNYSLLVEKVHQEFEPFGLSLSISVSAYGHEITPEAIDFVESVNVMAYDATPPHHSTFDFAISALDHWEQYGVPRRKLVLGLPFYGKTKDGTGYAYRDIFDAYHPDPDADFVGGIGFNGVSTIKKKTAYVVNNGYRGIMIWEISQDTSGQSSLLDAVVDAIMDCLPADLDGNGRIDLNDLQVFASAWHSDPNDGRWNPRCDIFRPLDSVVDSRDLAAFCRDWLVGRQMLFRSYRAREDAVTKDCSDAVQETTRQNDNDEP
jgi:Glycosyl hydrolases family 18